MNVADMPCTIPDRSYRTNNQQPRPGFLHYKASRILSNRFPRLKPPGIFLPVGLRTCLTKKSPGLKDSLMSDHIFGSACRGKNPACSGRRSRTARGSSYRTVHEGPHGSRGPCSHEWAGQKATAAMVKGGARQPDPFAWWV